MTYTMEFRKWGQGKKFKKEFKSQNCKTAVEEAIEFLRRNKPEWRKHVPLRPNTFMVPILLGVYNKSHKNLLDDEIVIDF